MCFLSTCFSIVILTIILFMSRKQTNLKNWHVCSANTFFLRQRTEIYLPDFRVDFVGLG